MLTSNLGSMPVAETRQLIACLHDVSPRDFERLKEIDRFYAAIGVGASYAMLVVPNFWRRWPLEEHPAFLEWLKERAGAGVEILLHGYFHYDTTPHSERSAPVRLRHALFGEGEFASLGEEEAIERLSAGRKLLEELLGIEVSSFVAPAWQYSAGARAALAALGFQIAENRAGVWRPATGRVLTRTPVIAYSSRSTARRNASIAWSKASDAVLAHARIVRHALHPADFNDEILRIEITRSLKSLLAARKAVLYRDLLAN